MRLGVSGEHRPLRMPRCKSALQALAISCGGKTPPRTYCIQEFANNNRAVNTMYGFPTESLRSKDFKGMYGLCTSTDKLTEETCSTSLTDRWLLTVTPSVLIEETRDMLSNGFGNCTWRRRVLSTNTIPTAF